MPTAARFSLRLPPLSARQLGIGSAVVTVLVWTAFILVARASAARSLTPFDLGLTRIVGASLVLMHWRLLAGLVLVTGGILFGVRKAGAVVPQSVPAATLSRGCDD